MFSGARASSSAHHNQVNLGADDALSKRTDLYARTGCQKASGKLVSAQASIGDDGRASSTCFTPQGENIREPDRDHGT
ncbi:hypothetical protein ACAX43_01005 [Paraburkholderia sp. IW21]|uniref:hypothetical protein n=1 Tax=Paraburkholderia sp. IW21 TaxID=3242488 RepID=UPI0035230EDC